MSEQQEQAKGRLFLYGTLEPRDELDERLERCHKDLSSSVSRLRDVEIYNHLNDKVNQSKEDHEDTNLALLYSILTDPSTASKQYHTLTMVNRDSFSLILSYTEKMVMEKTPKLQETTRIQLLWLTREVVQTGVAGADNLCFALLKQLPAGGTSSGDIYVAENLLHILLDNRDWLDGHPTLISSVMYTYLSLIPSHSFPALSNLRDQETQMCVSLMRTRFSECCQIGRDLVRLLQAVSRVPEFTELWKDILQHPQNISPQCTGLTQLLSRRTSRRFIGGRILMEVEIKLNFLLSKVKFGQHRPYQEWFQKKYLSSAESHHLIPELIRFICCVIHPTNEILASDVIPRWALIGWLISLCQNNPLAFANSKLALFYDWLSYNPESDNIMNIEPGILLMHHSLRAHPQVTASLLDFLCRMVTNFCPSQPQIADVGIKAALRDILNKGVLLSLDPIFESPRIDEELRTLVKNTFSEFILPLPAPDTSSMEVLEIAAGGGQETGGVILKGGGRSQDDPLLIGDDYLKGEDSEVMAAFSDSEMEEMEEGGGEEESEAEPHPPTSDNATPTSEEDQSEEFITLSSVDLDGDGPRLFGESRDPWARLSELPSSLGEKMAELKAEKDEESKTRMMADVLVLFEEVCKEDSDTSELLASPLADLMHTELQSTCAEADKEEENVEQDEGSAQLRLSNQLFKRLSGPTPATPTQSLTRHLQKQEPHVGYFFLCYLHRNHTPSADKPCYEPYRHFVSGGTGKLKDSLLKDLKCCVETEVELFFSLLPSLCKEFSAVLVGDHQIVNLIATHIDPAQLNTLMYQLLNKEFQLFGREASEIHDILMHSLSWESFEQYCVWQLLNAEGPEPSLVIPTLANMNSEEHPEAISCALLFLKNESSGYSSIATLLSLPTSLAPLVEVIGGRWVSGRPTKCAKILSQYLEGMEKKHGDKYPVSECTLILGHLQKIIQVLSSKQILEASESALCKTLSKQFKTFPQLANSFGELHKMTAQSSDTNPTKKEGGGHKRGGSIVNTSAQDKNVKHEPKTKRRRVTNRDDVMVIDP